MQLNFDLRDGLPLEFNYSGISWNNLTWFERKRHKYIKSFWMLIKGEFCDFINYSGFFGNKLWISYRYDNHETIIEGLKISKVPCPKGTLFLSIRLSKHILLLTWGC